MVMLLTLISKRKEGASLNFVDMADEENRRLSVWRGKKQKQLWNPLILGNLAMAVIC